MPTPCEYVGVTGEQCDRLNQVLSSVKSKPGKRPPSVYNLYTRACIKAKGGIKKFGQAGPTMKQCAMEYREDKAKGKFRYEVELPSNPATTLWKGRDLQAEWKNLYGKLTGGSKK